MKKRIFALVLVLMLILSCLTACSQKSGAVTGEEAQKIALEAVGLQEKDVTNVHAHVLDQDGIPCYSIHITAGDKEYSVVIHAGTGEVLSGAN